MLAQTFALYDVGGQRNERKKWIHVFDNVTGVIFVAALSEYDQTLFEDNDKNRMVEALELFEWICNHDLFKNVPTILFLNKMDLFRTKISTYPIATIPLWKEYKGSDDFTKAWQYFFEKFHASGTKSNPSKQIYAHVTCATDTSNVHHVFNSCRDIILKENLAGSGLI
jgi:GTPase SAR1 family protein